MSAYVDPLRRWGRRPGWPYEVSCHLMADTDEELHSIAVKIGLKRSWAQRMDHPRQLMRHYDITPPKRIQAIRAGAIEVTFSWVVIAVLAQDVAPEDEVAYQRKVDSVFDEEAEGD